MHKSKAAANYAVTHEHGLKAGLESIDLGVRSVTPKSDCNGKSEDARSILSIQHCTMIHSVRHSFAAAFAS